jgi:hypothetical protein
VTGRCYKNAHRASADVKATAAVFFHYWESRKGDIFEVTRRQQEQHGTDDNTTPPPQQDDINSSEEEEGSISSQSSEEEYEDVQQTGVQMGDEWDEANYDPSPVPSLKFKELFSHYYCGRGKRILGLKCNPMDVNSPIRAQPQIFTTTIINRIVKHTNNYGEVHCKAWSAITKRDLKCFFAVLFVASVQKRKDKPAIWFSSNPLLDNPIMKKVMTGRKFATML